MPIMCIMKRLPKGKVAICVRPLFYALDALKVIITADISNQLLWFFFVSGWFQNMLEKRPWPNIGFFILISSACVLLWKATISPFTKVSKPTVYTLLGQNHTEPSYYLPLNDYNQLIDLNFTFITLNLVCNDSTPLLLVLVHSSPSNFAKRTTIRETWGQKSENVKVLFMIGE